jgi:spore coat protein CotH
MFQAFAAVRSALILLFLFLSFTSAQAQTADDLFNGDILHEIRLEINPKDWQALKANPSSNTYYPCNFKWRNIEVDDVGIRSRGGSTRNSIKPGLRIDFNQYEATQQFLGLKSIALDNMAQDASMMKERLSMELFAKMNLPAPREVNARLYVNDEYAGLYTVIESTDKDFLKRTFGENDGYLYEYINAANYHFEYLGSDPSLYSPRFFEPKTHEKDPNPSPIEAMVRTINTASDADFPTAIASYFDLQLFMKHLAVEDFLAETDGILTGMNNFYLYRFENKNLSQFIVHDKDLTFGGPPTNLNRYANPFLTFAGRNVLIRRALNVTAARNAYFDTLRTLTLVAGGFGGWLENEIQRIYNQIRSAAYEDPYKVCFNGLAQLPCSNANFEDEVAANLDFARRRSDYDLGQLPILTKEGFFGISDRGGFSMAMADPSVPIATGYAMVLGDPPVNNPEGLAIFSFRQNGVVVTEATVPASTAIQHGILYAEISGPVRTGIAISNPGDQPANISFTFTDTDGKVSGQGSTVIAAHGQLTRFLDQAPFSSGSFTRGTFTFESSSSVFAIALRGLTNERSQFIISTLPVIDLSAPSTGSVIPHFADGGGWTTQTILVNPTGQMIRGTLEFHPNNGDISTTPYTIPPRSSFVLRTSNISSAIRSGSVRVFPGSDPAPSAFVVFSFRRNGVTVSEASVEAVQPASALRTWAVRTDSIQSGIAIANPLGSAITINLALFNLSGTSTGISGTLTIPGSGQVATFLEQVPGFERMPSPFEGILRISTDSASGIAVAGLRGRSNELRDFLIATVPSIDESIPASRTDLVFPYFVEGGGYTTQFILFSSSRGTTPTGVIRLYDQTGFPVSVW